MRDDDERASPFIGEASTVPIAEALLDFAEPALEFVGEDPDAEALERAFMMAVLVWNSSVLEDYGAGFQGLERTRRELEEVGYQPMLEVFDRLVERRRRAFANDLRAIGDFTIAVEPDGSFSLEAEARLPKTMDDLQ